MKGVSILPVPIHHDERGSPLALDARQSLPFELKRCYFIWGCPDGKSRAGHSVSAPMALIALRGQVAVDLDNASERLTLELSTPDRMVCIDAGVWLRLRDFSADALLAVASPTHHQDTSYFDSPQPALLERS